MRHLAPSLIALALAGCVPPTHAPDAGQPPINLTFDLHSDPEPQALPLDARRLYFRRQLANATWLLDTGEPYGVKLSFLAVGEFYEFCVEASERDACLPVLQRLQRSGGILGTHQHCQYQRGAHDWPDIANCYGNPSEAEVRKVWEDGQRLTDEAVRQALQLTDAAAVAAVNAACESHAQLRDPNQLMREFGYSIREGGGDQTLVPLFGHVPWNPFRPGATATAEDLSTPFLTIPQGMVLGHVGLHLGRQQDGRTPRKQAEFLEASVTWLERERTAAPPKVWAFGWGVHTQDLDVGSDSRAAAESLLPWLAAHAVGATSPAGRPVARWSGYLDARDEYLEWERQHPGTSSFSYEATVTDYARYPYLEWANRYLRETSLEAELPGPAGVPVYRLAAQGHALVLALAGSGAGTVDVSSLGAATVRRVELATGAHALVDAAQAPVGEGSVVLCAPADCDALLALGEAAADGGAPPPPPADGGQPCTATSCAGAQVCCPAGLVCAGRCVPDCRGDAGVACPSQAPSCDLAVGVCRP